MAKGQMHMGPKGPSACRAKTNESCPYAGDGHFDTAEEVNEAFALKMKAQGYNDTGKLSKKVSAIEKHIEATLKNKLLSELTIEEISQVGSLIEQEVFSRLKLDSHRGDFSDDELTLIAQETSTLLKSLDTHEIESSNKVHGVHSKMLKEALTVLPKSAVSIVTNDIYTVAVRSNSTTRDGYHIAQAAVMKPVEEETLSAIKISEKALDGEYALDEFAVSSFDVETNVYEGFALQKVHKQLGRSLQAGESALPALKLVPKSEDTLIELINNGVLDKSARLIEGQETAFEKQAPAYDEALKQVAVTSRFYAGKKPTGAMARDQKYVKVADSFEVRAKNGKVLKVEKPLYEIHEKSISYNAHTIGSKKYGGYDSAIKPVLLHEFTHAVQSAAPGGIPGEREIFQKIAAERNVVKADGYTYVEGFPDEYMGDQAGREVFTRATEGLFYPQLSGNDYLYNGKNENAKEVRSWALGNWALLTSFGSSKKRR